MACTQNRLNTAQSEGNLSVNSRLSDSRRQRLLDIKKREDLKDALTEKYRGRYGTGSQDKADDEVSVASAMIRDEVGKFTSKANVTSSNLSRLDRRIQSKAKGDAASEVSGYSMASGMSRSRSVSSMAGAGIVSNQRNPTVKADWSQLDEYASYLHEQDTLRQALGVKALQKKMRSDLDAQVNMKQSRKQAEEHEDKQYHTNTMVELERWKEMEALRAQEKADKVKREKEDRDKQLEYERALKQKDSEQKKMEESALVKKIVSEMEAEQARFAKKKENTKKAMRKVFEENERDQAKKKIEEREQKERESAKLKEYAEILDKAEADKEAEMKARLERQSDLMKQLQDNVDGIKKGAGDNDAARALAQQEEMDRHFFEAENVKQNRLAELRRENQAYLIKQIEERDSRKNEELELQNIQAQILERDTEEYNEIERLKVVNRRKHLVEHQQDIKKQMAYKLQQSTPQMSEEEKRMNKPLLELVNRTLGQKEPPAMIPECDDE